MWTFTVSDTPPVLLDRIVTTLLTGLGDALA
jgi:hypothetical protein